MQVGTQMADTRGGKRIIWLFCAGATVCRETSGGTLGSSCISCCPSKCNCAKTDEQRDTHLRGELGDSVLVVQPPGAVLVYLPLHVALLPQPRLALALQFVLQVNDGSLQRRQLYRVLLQLQPIQLVQVPAQPPFQTATRWPCCLFALLLIRPKKAQESFCFTKPKRKIFCCNPEKASGDHMVIYRLNLRQG